MPSALTATVPLPGRTTAVTVSVSPSTSVSLASTSTVDGVVLGCRAVSSTATGASLTGVTVMVTVAVAVPPLPSVMV